ncbi:MAG: DUF420 domain-containing protein [Bacteroidota bacterium]
MTTAAAHRFRPLIIGISVLLPIAVAVLYFSPKLDLGDFNVRLLPLINAWINGITSVILVLGFLAIRIGNRKLHQRLMSTALIMSILFLIIYVIYHASAAEVKYGGEGIIRGVYFFLLISHILCAAIIAPLVLITYVRALSERFDKHRKIARITLPIWLYVSITGVIVYLMIRVYY